MKILIAEDDAFYRRMLESLLRGWGHDVVAVADGTAAWNHLRAPDAPALAILDWVMPGLDGVELCRRVRALRRPEPTYLLILTAKGGKDNIVTALDAGADDYVTKPFDHDELQARLRVGLRVVGLQLSQAVVFTFARAVEAKSPYTQGHAERVTRYAVRLAARLGAPEEDLEILRQGGLLHDLGKIRVPDHILDKPGPLTPEEYEVVKQHPVHGVRIVEPLQSIREAIPIIRWHHERRDGRGYPDGLTDRDIPPLVKILSVADVYDALASPRPYRPAIPHARCLAMLAENAAGGGLEPDYVRCFCEFMPSAPSGEDDPFGTDDPLPDHAQEFQKLA